MLTRDDVHQEERFGQQSVLRGSILEQHATGSCESTCRQWYHLFQVSCNPVTHVSKLINHATKGENRQVRYIYICYICLKVRIVRDTVIGVQLSSCFRYSFRYTFTRGTSYVHSSISSTLSNKTNFQTPEQDTTEVLLLIIIMIVIYIFSRSFRSFISFECSIRSIDQRVIVFDTSNDNRLPIFLVDPVNFATVRLKIVTEKS